MLFAMRPAVVILAALSVITGVAYPVLITLVAQGVFPHQANGSLVYRPDARPRQEGNSRDWLGAHDAPDSQTAIGSELIGQAFAGEGYFWSRPSATGPVPYNAAASSGSNYGPTNPAQLDSVRERVARLREVGDDQRSPAPIDLVTASASGLDPHISPAAAEYQAPRIARARGLGDYEVRRLIAENVEHRTLGLLGEPRVNVLRLNLALDQLKQPPISR
ncbi:MAG TPA: potassium-transporting ATPase subunit KdpC [Lacipirellulaceae bacterium]|nr:potassium-transporting ATPase subunit KdpC [Lacipirellulaceae bacterium]